MGSCQTETAAHEGAADEGRPSAAGRPSRAADTAILAVSGRVIRQFQFPAFRGAFNPTLKQANDPYHAGDAWGGPMPAQF